MRLEFHQLDRRLENLRVRHPARQRRLVASLAEVGQQTPIIVIETARPLSGHRRSQAHHRTPATGPRHGRGGRLGDERSRRAGAGPVAADERAGERDRTRLAAGRDGIPFGLLAGRTRPALRPRQDVGSHAAWRWWRRCRNRCSNWCAKARSLLRSPCGIWRRRRASAGSIAGAWPPLSPNRGGRRGKRARSIAPGATPGPVRERILAAPKLFENARRNAAKRRRSTGI